MKAGIVVYSFDAAKGEFVLTHDLIKYSARCIGVAFGPFDQTVISRHDDGTIIMWDLETTEKLVEKKIHERLVRTGVEII